MAVGDSLARSFFNTESRSVAVMAAGLFAFRTRTGTLVFYGVGGTIFSTLLVGARFFQDRLEWMSFKLMEKLGGSLSEDTINVNSFSDRLQGFAGVLTNPDAYTWFGYGAARGTDPRDPLYNHDLLSATLVRYGAVPLFVLVIATITFLVWTHGHMLGIRDTRRRHICAATLSLAMSFFAISITSGNVLSIFPVNTFFWLAVTATIVIVAADARAHAPVRAKAPLPSNAPLPGGDHRFIRTVHPMPQS